MNPLLTRIDKEAKVTAHQASLRCWRVVCIQGDEAAGTTLAQARGYDPDDAGDLLMLHSIVTPTGHAADPRKPYLIDRQALVSA